MPVLAQSLSLATKQVIRGGQLATLTTVGNHAVVQTHNNQMTTQESSYNQITKWNISTMAGPIVTLIPVAVSEIRYRRILGVGLLAYVVLVVFFTKVCLFLRSDQPW